MLSLTGLNGKTFFIAAATVARIRRRDALGPADVTEVEHYGGYLFTREPLDKLLARVARELRLVELTAPNNTKVYLNPSQIALVRNASPFNGPGTEVTVGGHYQHVTETVDEVLRLVEQA